MNAALIFSAVLACVSTTSALAAGGGDPPPRAAADPVVEKATAAIAAKDWKQAQDVMRQGLDKSPTNADYHNLFAYSLRMGANPPMDVVFKHYNEALRIDSSHRGAHEYLGEAYLMSGNLEKAKDHLKALDKLCLFSCKEFRMLKQAVADFEAKQPKK